MKPDRKALAATSMVGQGATPLRADGDTSGDEPASDSAGCRFWQGLAPAALWRGLIGKALFQIERVTWLRDLYVDRHLDLSFRDAPLEDAEGRCQGVLTEVRVRRGRIELSGWAEGRDVAVMLGKSRVLGKWDRAMPAHRAAHRAFHAEFPFETGPLSVEISGGGRKRLRCHPVVPIASAVTLARARLGRRFWIAFLPLVPGIACALLRGDKDVNRRLKHHLGLVDAEPAPLLDAATDGPGHVLDCAYRVSPALRGFRTALDEAQALAGPADIPVYIAHSLGGGAQTYLDRRLRGDTVALVLRLGGPRRFRLELTTSYGQALGEADDPELVTALLCRLTTRRIVYSNAAGDPDLAALPDFILSISAGRPLEVLFHDYLPFSPSCTLLDHDGSFRGIPRPDRCDPAHRYRGPDGRILPLGEWQARWGRLLDRAGRLVAFSEPSAALIAAARPRLAGRIEVVPHELPHPVPRLVATRGGPVVMGVLGAIGPPKGAAAVSALSRRLEHVPGIGLAVIGRLAPGFALAPGTRVHGDYVPEDLPVLATRYGITHWLIPSVWPETFSYTTHEALATGLPTLAFDLGAQGMAVRAAPNGLVVAWDGTPRAPEILAARVQDVLTDSLRQPSVALPAGVWPPLSSVISAAARATISPRDSRRFRVNRADGPETDIPATGWPAPSKIAAPMHDMPS